jgi:hypothetical protein
LKTLIAIILAIELTISIWLILLSTFVIYILSGIIAYLVAGLISTPMENLQTPVAIFLLTATLIVALVFCLRTIEHFYKPYLLATIFIPIVIAVVYIFHGLDALIGL